MDEFYMRQALEIAKYAYGRTSPNPLVGAVVVKDDRIVGQGWHRQAGTEHAEVHALRQAGVLCKGATIYVTLEPCSHYGKTPPCADAIISAGITKVVIGMLDPNPLVAGRGVKKMQEAGIAVVVGVLTAEAQRLNEVFLKWIIDKKPFIVLKTAMTLDGKISTVTGHSRWITNSTSRQRVHQLRDIYDGILVGVGTVLADDPELTTRLVGGGKNPVRIIVDSLARTPLTAKVVNDKAARTIIAVTAQANEQKVAALKAAGVEVLVIPADENNQVDLVQLTAKLGLKNICSILVEGGATINFSFINNKLVDKVYSFIAPKIIGGKEALTPVAGTGLSNLDNALLLENISTEILAGDILITGYVKQEEL